MTGPDGIARVHTSAKPDLGLVIEASAEGYGLEITDYQGPTAPDAAAKPATVELFAARPTVEFLLPPGFHGLIKAEIRIQDPPSEPRHRLFQGLVASDGMVQITGSTVFRHGLGPLYQARTADGNPLPLEPKENEAGLRFLKTAGSSQIFVVGTRDEWSEYRRSMNTTDPPGASPKVGRSGQSGGGGRGGRGGGRGGMGGGGGRGGF